MNNYKPEYLGQVIPANDPSKLIEFVETKYDAFNKVYDACKGQSENIQGIQPVSSDDSVLSVQVSASPEAIANIKENVTDDDTVSVEDGKITVKT